MILVIMLWGGRATHHAHYRQSLQVTNRATNSVAITTNNDVERGSVVLQVCRLHDRAAALVLKCNTLCRKVIRQDTRTLPLRHSKVADSISIILVP